MSQEKIKQAVGKVAASLVQNGMLIGLGTGSTSTCFIHSLIQRCKEGLKIQAVASSEASSMLAKQGGIPLLDVNTITSLDLYIDGTDEIDAKKRMIKGGGGALVREKILASMADEMIVVMDASKKVDFLGKHPLPVEIIPFGIQSTIEKFMTLTLKGNLRLGKDQKPYITDNGNYIYDILLKYPCVNPEEIHQTLIKLPGVVDTGFFFHLAGRCVTGFPDGQVIIT